jgi:hypothetical protein
MGGQTSQFDTNNTISNTIKHKTKTQNSGNTISQVSNYLPNLSYDDQTPTTNFNKDTAYSERMSQLSNSTSQMMSNLLRSKAKVSKIHKSHLEQEMMTGSETVNMNTRPSEIDQLNLGMSHAPMLHMVDRDTMYLAPSEQHNLDDMDLRLQFSGLSGPHESLSGPLVFETENTGIPDDESPTERFNTSNFRNVKRGAVTGPARFTERGEAMTESNCTCGPDCDPDCTCSCHYKSRLNTRFQVDGEAFSI